MRKLLVYPTGLQEGSTEQNQKIVSWDLKPTKKEFFVGPSNWQKGSSKPNQLIVSRAL